MYRVKYEPVAVDAGLINNNGLSFGARGLLIYLLAQPSGQFYFNELAEAIESGNAEGIDQLVDYMIEIAQAGFASFENGELVVTEFAQASSSPEDIPLLVRDMKHERRPEIKLSLAERYREAQ